MAQTKRRRRRKRRGTQGGRVDTRPRGRPRNRAEAKQRARARGGSGRSAGKGRGLTPPTWRSAFLKGLAAAGIFVVLIVLAFSRPLAPAAAIGALMLVFYVPMAYFTDGFFYRRTLRKQEQERLARAQNGGGADAQG